MNLPEIAMCLDDAEIKTMLAANSIEMVNPSKLHDTVVTSLTYGGRFWLVVRSTGPNDPGYMAAGIPENSSKEHRQALYDCLMTVLDEAAVANDMINVPMFVELDRVENS